ncbi:cyclin N-terminal domain-containing protein 1 isoform X1 [Gopherus flavomarginatus]|uniref:cyclin N-terminal domain-containing protein 1 isoform X1 n=1 Tax=Gopherus flavomarginatus TaxID=286002 RepID=UPI0021CC0795|nr:cyclin N-terminal domain-containing protein 1 isoform X1 [Gopherus flavomarginatus]
MSSEAQAVSRFRTPEPVFGVVAPEIIEDTLICLATENEQYLNELSDQAGCFKETQIVEFVFLLCEKWFLDQSARYQAVEIFERFMIKHVEESYNSIKKSRTNNEQGEDNIWGTLKAQICDTFVLRLVSCIQLASKLSFHYNIINNNTVLKFLQSLDYSYTKQNLVESELAILKALCFQINVPTPFAYVELLLEVLGHNGCLLPMKQLHKMCMHLLDLTYLMRNIIYDTLLKISIENSTPSELQIAKFLSVKEDFMLLAVGIISTSAFILNPEYWNQVLLDKIYRVQVLGLHELKIFCIFYCLQSTGVLHWKYIKGGVLQYISTAGQGEVGNLT